MSIIKIWKAWLCAAVLPLYLGGGGGESSSDSSTTTSNTTTNTNNVQDKRNVASDSAVSLSGDGNKVTTSDYGSVTAALTSNGALGSKALDVTAASLSGAIDLLKSDAVNNKDIFNQTLKQIGANADATNSAFQAANESASGIRVLALAGLVVVGAVMFKKGIPS